MVTTFAKLWVVDGKYNTLQEFRELVPDVDCKSYHRLATFESKALVKQHGADVAFDEPWRGLTSGRCGSLWEMS